MKQIGIVNEKEYGSGKQSGFSVSVVNIKYERSQFRFCFVLLRDQRCEELQVSKS